LLLIAAVVCRPQMAASTAAVTAPAPGGGTFLHSVFAVFFATEQATAFTDGLGVASLSTGSWYPASDEIKEGVTWVCFAQAVGQNVN
jgi:hypothetical protein